MNTITVYMTQAIGAPLTGIFFGQTSHVFPVSGNLDELYSKIGDFLGHDVLCSTDVVTGSWTPSPARLANTEPPSRGWQ